MKLPISLVLIVALIASGCASMHDPATRGSESALIDTTAKEAGKQDAETPEVTAMSSAEELEWAQAQRASNLGSSKFFGLLIVGWTLGLYALWKLIFD
ncbi:MAG: hypothetical protein OXH31_06140 [Gammaproteobacteria bacterium]|nr:hypothetical protein [Gammaproteobacteria bacterium]